MRRIIDHPIIALIGIVSSCLAIFIFVTGKASLRDIFDLPGPSTTPATPGQEETTTSAPPPQLPATSTTGWSGILEARRPTLNEIRAEIPVSIWDANAIVVEDVLSPGRLSYSGTVQVGTEYLFPVYWCALTADILRQNMENLETVISLNGEIIPEKFILTYDYDTDNGWKCTYNSVVLGGWVSNGRYTLEATRTFLTEISDGRLDYPPGLYVYELNIVVR